NALGTNQLNSTAGSSGGSLSGASPTSEQLLTIKLDPLDLKLLGLEITTETITVTVSAAGGDSKLLGNLLTAISTLINLNGVETALNNVLTETVGLVNSVSLSLSPGAVGSGSF